MREADLPSPGFGSKSMHLRRIAANTISAVQIAAVRSPGGASSEAVKLKAFFDACSAAALEASKTTPAMTLTTAGNATSVAVSATLATTVGKGGSTGAVTYASSDATKATVNASGVVTGVAAGSVTITATMAATTTHRAASKSVVLTVTA